VTLLVLFGPPAVGKMTVGRAIADASDFRLFHNHHTIEPLLDVFDYGTPPFNRLLGEFRQRVLDEAAAHGTDVVFTIVWDLESEEDLAEFRRQLQPFLDAGRRIVFVELAAGLDVRLDRNRTEYRLMEKKSKRDVEWSDGNVRDMERYLMNTDRPTPSDALLAEHPHLRIDNTDLSPETVAAQVLAWLESHGSSDVNRT
jgi:hypothetical protein